jgi:small subunit ribosomal protein S17
MPKRILVGRVVSNSCLKTVTVLVERKVMHPVYKKFIKRSKKFMAHDELCAFKVGDVVQIEECRPLSARKSWIVIGSSSVSAD